MRLIDADALPKYTGMALSATDVAKAVENAPTIDPVKHGKWDKNKIAFHWKCSECGAAVFDNPATVFDYTGKEGLNFCPNCGAKMEDE